MKLFKEALYSNAGGWILIPVNTWLKVVAAYCRIAKMSATKMEVVKVLKGFRIQLIDATDLPVPQPRRFLQLCAAARYA